MQPRLKTSQKWTVLPKELTAQMKTVLAESFAGPLGEDGVRADGRIYPSEILMSVGIKRANSLKQSGFEISIAYEAKRDNVMKLLHLGMDAAGALFEQIFASENDHDFPRVWQKVDFEGREIYIQYTTANDELEAEADRWLGQAGIDGVARGEWDEDIGPEHIKAQLGIADDETDDDPEDER